MEVVQYERNWVLFQFYFLFYNLNEKGFKMQKLPKKLITKGYQSHVQNVKLNVEELGKSAVPVYKKIHTRLRAYLNSHHITELPIFLAVGIKKIKDTFFYVIHFVFEKGNEELHVPIPERYLVFN